MTGVLRGARMSIASCVRGRCAGRRTSASAARADALDRNRKIAVARARWGTAARSTPWDPRFVPGMPRRTVGAGLSRRSEPAPGAAPSSRTGASMSAIAVVGADRAARLRRLRARRPDRRAVLPDDQRDDQRAGDEAAGGADPEDAGRRASGARWLYQRLLREDHAGARLDEPCQLQRVPVGQADAAVRLRAADRRRLRRPVEAVVLLARCRSTRGRPDCSVPAGIVALVCAGRRPRTGPGCSRNVGFGCTPLTFHSPIGSGSCSLPVVTGA